MKKKMIVAGSSHTFGLGLELQHAKRFNDVDYLKKHGVMLPIEHTEEDKEIWNKYRWSRLLSNSLNLEEININDQKHDPFWVDGTCNNTLLKFLELNDSQTRDIEMVIVQPYPERLEYFDKESEKIITLTAGEMLSILDNKNSDRELIHRIKNFIETYDQEKRFFEFSSLFKAVVDRHPHIKFYLILWYDSERDILRYRNSELFVKYIEPHLLKFYNRHKQLRSPFELLSEYRMLIFHNAFCYTNRLDSQGKARWGMNEPDLHASDEGNVEIYLQILKQIKWEITDGNV